MGDGGMTANAKLQMERENLAWLKEQCVESEKLTSGMVEIFESFETRLGKLEQTIHCEQSSLFTKKLATFSDVRKTLRKRSRSLTM